MKFEATCYNIWSSSITVSEFIVDVPDKTFWRKSNQDYGLTTYTGIFKRTNKHLRDHIDPIIRNSHDFIYLAIFDDICIISIHNADTIHAIECAIANQQDTLKDSILNHYYIRLYRQWNGEYCVGELMKVDKILFNSYLVAVVIDLEDNHLSISQATDELNIITGHVSNTNESNWYRIDDDKAPAIWRDAQMYVMSRLGFGHYEPKIQWGINLGTEKIKQFESQFFTKKPKPLY